jgi:hypothetical protein
MRAMNLRALRAVCLFAPERGAQYHADGDAHGKPDANVSSQHTENRSQHRSQRYA